MSQIKSTWRISHLLLLLRPARIKVLNLNEISRSCFGALDHVVISRQEKEKRKKKRTSRALMCKWFKARRLQKVVKQKISHQIIINYKCNSKHTENVNFFWSSLLPALFFFFFLIPLSFSKLFYELRTPGYCFSLVNLFKPNFSKIRIIDSASEIRPGKIIRHKETSMYARKKLFWNHQWQINRHLSE